MMSPVFVIVVVLAGIAVIMSIQGRQQRARFEEQFPPISDNQFLARCKPGTNPEVALKVRRIISEQLAVEYERIHPSSSFTKDLGAD